MTNGCDHSELVPREELPPVLGLADAVDVCAKCSAVICGPVWRRLHPPPEPPKSWVRRKAEACNVDDQQFADELMRETVEECCRWLVANGWTPSQYGLRRAMLEPKP